MNDEFYLVYTDESGQQQDCKLLDDNLRLAETPDRSDLPWGFAVWHRVWVGPGGCEASPQMPYLDSVVALALGAGALIVGRGVSAKIQRRAEAGE